MLRSRRAPACPVCEQAVPRRAARFCGRCGAVLAARTDSSGRSTGRGLGGSRWRVTVAGGAVLAAGVAAIVQSTDLTTGGLGEPPQEVDLTDGTTGAPLEAAGELAEDERAELEVQAAEARLRCEPRGCERWRLTPADVWARVGSTSDQVLVLRDVGPEADAGASSGRELGPAELLVIDAQTGEEMVRRELDIERARRGSTSGSFAATVLGDGIVVAVDGTIASMTLEGEVRWQQRLTSERIWYLRPHHHRLVAFGGDLLRAITRDRADGPWEVGTVHVLDGATGASLWSAPGELSGTLDEEVAVLSTSTDRGLVTRAHDVDDGTVRWERATTQIVHNAPEREHVVLAGDEDAAGDVLVDAHTGADLLSLDGTLVTTMDRTDGRSYLLIDRTPRGDDRGEPVVHGDDSDLFVLALDADGEVAWQTDVAASLDGYARLSAPADRLFLISERGATVAFDVESGDVQPVDAPSDTRTGPEVWTDGGGREIRPTADGLRIESPTGWAQVRGEHGAWLVDDDPLLVTDGATLLAVDPVPD